MKVRFLVLVFALMLLASCANTNNSNGTPGATPQPHSTRNTEEKKDEQYGDSPALTYVQGVALCLADDGSSQLYTACELKNNSDCPCIINSVTYTVEISGETYELSVEQPAGQYCVVYPGEITYNAAWHNKKVTESDTLSLVSVKAEVEKSAFVPAKITGENMFVVHNYPAFTTVSGDLTCSGHADRNVIYCGFYDESDNLICVWCFTEPGELGEIAKTHFTSHMRNLLIDGLEETAKRVYVTGYGY